MAWMRTLAGITVAIATAGGGYHLWQQRLAEQAGARALAEASQPVLAPAITVSKVVVADFVAHATVTGSLIPREEILVSPEVDGFRVLELFADEGSTVRKGQVLARLVSEQLDAQAAQNDAALARSEAAIAQAKSAIVQAEAVAKEAKAQLDRAEPLRKSGYLSGATFDQRESAARAAAAQLAAARDALTAAEADKTQVEAQRRELDWRRKNTDVTAPEDGIVSRRAARIGATASSNAEPMFRIIAKGEVELDAEIVETSLGKIREGQTAVVTVPGTGSFKGEVRLISPEVDRATRLGRLRIFLGNDPALRIGSYAQGSIEIARSRGKSVPAASVTFEPDGAYVQTVEANTVKRRKIRTGLVVRDEIEVIDGLEAGDMVVTRAGTFLRDGDVIRPILPAAKLSENR
jgi:HlyD family secretion protein